MRTCCFRCPVKYGIRGLIVYEEEAVCRFVSMPALDLASYSRLFSTPGTLAMRIEALEGPTSSPTYAVLDNPFARMVRRYQTVFLRHSGCQQVERRIYSCLPYKTATFEIWVLWD
jgi:hypothetical protein